MFRQTSRVQTASQTAVPPVLPSPVDAKAKTIASGHSFSRIPIGSVQPKLAVNTPGDTYEKEADAMADDIIRSSHSSQETASPSTGLGFSFSQIPVHSTQSVARSAEQTVQRDLPDGGVPDAGAPPAGAPQPAPAPSPAPNTNDSANAASPAAAAAPSPAPSSTAPAAPYHGDYPWSSPTVDSATSAAWDLAGVIPGVSTITGAAATAIDAGKAGIDMAFGDTKSAEAHWGAASQDAVGMIPGVGTYMGAASLGWDVGSTIDRANGKSADAAPNSGDMWNNKVLPALGQGLQAVGSQPDVPGRDM